MKLYEIYTDMLILEIGEGTSDPFEYKNNGNYNENFSYTIYGEVKDENNDKVLAKVPIKLQGMFIKQTIDQEYGEWTVDGYDEMEEYGKFLNVSPGTTITGYEIIFSLIEGDSFAEVNDRVFMFRLMATIKKILQDEFAKSKPDIIVYSPGKKGDEEVEKTGRHRLYNAFIKKAFPNARVFVDDRSEEITYKLK